jgi:hypothetical protein
MKRLGIAFALIALLSLAFVPTTHAQKTHIQAPATYCFDAGSTNCDGKTPVPSMDCSIGGWYAINNKTLYDTHGNVIGSESLYFSNANGCYAWWDVLWNRRSAGSLNVIDIDVHEAGDDNSGYGNSANLLSPGDAVATAMIGDPNTAPASCFHGHSIVLDPWTAQQLTTNTNTYCL